MGPGEPEFRARPPPGGGAGTGAAAHARRAVRPPLPAGMTAELQAPGGGGGGVRPRGDGGGGAGAGGPVREGRGAVAGTGLLPARSGPVLPPWRPRFSSGLRPCAGGGAGGGGRAPRPVPAAFQRSHVPAGSSPWPVLGVEGSRPVAAVAFQPCRLKEPFRCPPDFGRCFP